MLNFVEEISIPILTFDFLPYKFCKIYEGFFMVLMQTFNLKQQQQQQQQQPNKLTKKKKKKKEKKRKEKKPDQ